jgi:hydrogenase nickel incorporation protein HypA/HybF
MHELAIAEGLIDAVTGRLPGRKISSVQLEIGALSGVVADSLRFCFDLATEGTTLEGALLEISEPPARCECHACGAGFTPDGPIVLCPCGSADVAVVSGQQLLITSVKVA